MQVTITTSNGKSILTELTTEQAKELGIVESKVWKPEQDERVYYPTVGERYYTFNAGSDFHERDYNMGMTFKTLEESEKQYEYMCAVKRIKDYCLENFGEFVPDWKDRTQHKCYAYYNNVEEVFRSDYCTNHRDAIVLPYLSERFEVEQLINNMEPDLKIVFGITN